ncbi:MAG: hypothetical protein WBA45_03470 [Microthrixaceae bacterium]
MKLVRIDAIGTDELHPRLTLLRGSSPEFRRRILGLLDSIASLEKFPPAGLIEVNGVQLSLDNDTITQLQLDQNLSWVIDWTDQSSGATTGQGTGPVTSQGSGATTGPAAGSRPSDRPPPYRMDLENLRTALRATAGERSSLATHMDQVRTRLDSFANAALEVCVGQIDALEARRSSLRRRFESAKSVADEQLVELEATYHEHLAEIDAVESLNLDAVRAARDQLAHQLQSHRGPDPKSTELALRIDATMRRVRDLSGRAAAVSLRRREAEQRLAECVAEVSAAERAMRQRRVDPDVVARLEQVRDEMFAADERQSRLSVNRNRRRMLSLREEEARLLAQIGFDTYSSYVMGIPSMRSEVERSSRLDQAQSRVDEIQHELDSMDEPAESLLSASEAELRDLLRAAAALLGDNTVGTVGSVGSVGTVGTADQGESQLGTQGASSFEPTNAPAADDVALVIEKLRSSQLGVMPDDDHTVLQAAAELRHAIMATAGGRFAGSDPTKPPRIAGSAIAPFSWTGTPSALLGAVDAWLVRLSEPAAWLKAARESVEGLRLQIEERRESGEAPADVSEWAQVESELDTLLDKLVGAQERVRRHEEALVELAAMREQELAIRARERDLLAQLSEAEAEIENPAEAIPAPQLSDRAQPSAGGAEWRLIEFAARRMSVSFAGPLPIVMVGLGDIGNGRGAAVEVGDRNVRDAVFERVRRLSELVQMVLIDDREWLSERVAALGLDARIMDLGGPPER